MTVCTQQQIEFPSLCSRKVVADFKGGDVSSDGGVMLLQQADRRLKLTEKMAALLPDERDAARCDHSMRDLLRQRVYALALGYEDGNDHLRLRDDVLLQTAVGRTSTMASPATLCRWENAADRATAWAMHAVLVGQFIASFAAPPDELILDFDATDDVVHGHQEGRFFHGYYDNYCFLPLYVFCGPQLLVSYLRPANHDAARHAAAILNLLVRRLRQAWPAVKIILRGDSGFCRHLLMSWCDRNNVGYILGLAKNERLLKLGAAHLEKAAADFAATKEKQRHFAEFRYAASTWKHDARVILKAEHTDKGANPRHIVTNLEGDAQQLYDKTFCGRGEMENRIKEQQLDLFADRTSCTKWWANQFRLLLAGMAYVLMETIRRVGLKDTELERAQCGTIRLKLLKIGAVIVRNTRRILIHLSEAFPHRELFAQIIPRLSTA